MKRMYSPLEQFELKTIIRIYTNWLDLSITNNTIFLLFSSIIILSILSYSISNNNLISTSRWKFLIEKLYLEIESIIKGILPNNYNKYIPFGLILFLFILFNNLIGLVPYSFTTTSHFAVTMTFSFSIMIGLTLLGFYKHKFKFFTLFLPSGLNQGAIKLIIPLIFLIEILSYLIRVISLSVRLAANLLSGHTLLKIIANFGLKYTISFPVLMIIPLGLLTGIYVLEMAVAVIQAYVFTLLTLTYVKDVELLH